MSRFQFVEDLRETYEVKRLCQVLGIHRSSYYKWRSSRQARAAQQAGDDALVERIQTHHQEWDGTLGYRRMTVELREDEAVEGPVNHKRVARLMRERNIVGAHLRKGPRTTVPDQGARVFEDLLDRDFTADAPNTAYVGDITYLPCGQGRFLYLATVIDLCSKQLTGWSIADHMRADLATEALEHAAASRGSLDGAIFHSDHGRQYTSSAFQATCRSLGVVQSMGRIGSSADNAAAEAFNASLKRETLQGTKAWACPRQCRQDVFRWVTRYNTRRKHSALGYRSPLAFEADYAATIALTA